MLEIARCEVAWRTCAVGGHDIDVGWPIEHPVFVVEPREETFDLARCTPAVVFGVVALVRRSADEGDPLTVGAERQVAQTIFHGRDNSRLACRADGHDVQRCVALLLAATRRKRERDTIGAPGWVAVVFAAGDRTRRMAAVAVGQPDL